MIPLPYARGRAAEACIDTEDLVQDGCLTLTRSECPARLWRGAKRVGAQPASAAPRIFSGGSCGCIACPVLPPGLAVRNGIASTEFWQYDDAIQVFRFNRSVAGSAVVILGMEECPLLREGVR
jgi:hypothetical protein